METTPFLCRSSMTVVYEVYPSISSLISVVQPQSESRKSKHNRPTTYEQCLDLLWNHSGGQKTRDNLDKLMAAFVSVYPTLEGETLRRVVVSFHA